MKTKVTDVGELEVAISGPPSALPYPGHHPASRPIPGLLHAYLSSLGQALSYLRVRAISVPALLVNHVGNGAFRVSGPRSTRFLCIGVCGCES